MARNCSTTSIDTGGTWVAKPLETPSLARTWIVCGPGLLIRTLVVQLAQASVVDASWNEPPSSATCTLPLTIVDCTSYAVPLTATVRPPGEADTSHSRGFPASGSDTLRCGGLPSRTSIETVCTLGAPTGSSRR